LVKTYFTKEKRLPMIEEGDEDAQKQHRGPLGGIDHVQILKTNTNRMTNEEQSEERCRG